MNMSQIIKRVASRTGHSLFATKAITDALFEELRSTFDAGEPVTIHNFGKFDVREHKGVLLRDPRFPQAENTGERTAPFRYVHFKAKFRPK